MKNKLNENYTEKGFTITYPNGDFYIGKPYDLYELMTDFLIDWDNDKTVMTEYEAEDVASIRENYEEVFYAALEGGNYWEGQEFEEAFGRFSDYGIANALSINENKTLNEDKATYEELQQQVKQLLRKLKIKTSLGISIGEHSKTVLIFAYTLAQAERWVEKLEAAGYDVELYEERGNVKAARFIMPELKTNKLNEDTIAGFTYAEIAAAVEDEAYRAEVGTSQDYYEIYVSIRDDYPTGLGAQQVNTILRGDEPWENWYDLESDIHNNSWDWLNGNKTELIERVMKNLGSDSDELHDHLLNNVYVDYDAEPLLDWEYEMFFNINTGDGNYDYTLNPQSQMTEEEILELDEEASIVWLAKTQGYTREDVINAITKGEYKGSEFLKSVDREYIDSLSQMNSIIFLGKMDLRQMIESKSGGSIEVPVGTVVGYWDGWYGSGSALDIVLEKPVTVPYEIRDRIYTANGPTNDVYTPQEIFGLVSEAYNARFTLVK